MTAAEMAALLQKKMQEYMGKAMEVSELDGYFFVDVSHFRHFFYVYSYVYGILTAKALASRFEKDPSYKKEIKTFLSAGGSRKPDDIFKSIGIDTRKPAIFEEGLRSVEADIKELERLAKSLGKL
jgi:oligoendopeptidase F